MYIRERFNIPKIGHIPLYVIIVIFVFVIAILQDYIYSRLKQTGFYLSESALYNTFWMFFIPLTIFINRLITLVNLNNKWGKLPFHLGIGITFSFFHIVLFTAFFVLVSNLVYSAPHRFSRIFNTVFSNQFYITLVWYVIFPAVYSLKRKPAGITTQYPEKIKVKIGTKIMTIRTSTIQLITTDKPYSVIFANEQKILDTQSLKEFETKLDPTFFLRVHRSAIINASYITELKSRNNGDYDVTLHNGQVIRVSRHYRKNWQQLLH